MTGFRCAVEVEKNFVQMSVLYGKEIIYCDDFNTCFSTFVSTNKLSTNVKSKMSLRNSSNTFGRQFFGELKTSIISLNNRKNSYFFRKFTKEMHLNAKSSIY